jgi:hypothetical protein
MSTVGPAIYNLELSAGPRGAGVRNSNKKSRRSATDEYSAGDGPGDVPEELRPASVGGSVRGSQRSKRAAEPTNVYPYPSEISAYRTDVLARSILAAPQTASDPQSLDPPHSEKGADQGAEASDEPSADDILEILSRWARAAVPDDIWVRCELTQFDAGQREKLLPILWDFIEKNRDTNSRSRQIDVGSAIRKYVALMPTERMNNLAQLLNDHNRSPLPLKLEIEVVKMIYHLFMAHPPSAPEPFPPLAAQLIKMVRDYAKPRLLARDGYAAAAVFAIDALVALRSTHAESAVDTAIQSCRWFSEVVEDDLRKLHERWERKNAGAANWLAEMLNKKFSAECGKKE